MRIPKAVKLQSGLWRIQLRLDGKSTVVTGRSEREVKKEAERLKMEHRLGLILPGNEADAEPSDVLTLRDIITRYINSNDNVLSPATIRGYDSYMRNRFKAVMDQPFDINTNWQEVVNDESKLISAKYLKNVWSLVDASIDAYGYPHITVNLPKIPKSEARFLDPEDVSRFLHAIRGTDIEMVCLLGLHSLRRSEILPLQKASIKDGFIVVRGSVVMDRHGKYVNKDTNKTEESTRTIPILLERLDELIKMRRNGPLVKGDPVNMYKKINRFCDENGFERMGYHGFRHSFVVLGFEAGLSVYTVQRIGGWKTEKTVNDIYTHLSERQKQNAYNCIGEVLKRHAAEDTWDCIDAVDW